MIPDPGPHPPGPGTWESRVTMLGAGTLGLHGALDGAPDLGDSPRPCKLAAARLHPGLQQLQLARVSGMRRGPLTDCLRVRLGLLSSEDPGQALGVDIVAHDIATHETVRYLQRAIQAAGRKPYRYGFNAARKTAIARPICTPTVFAEIPITADTSAYDSPPSRCNRNTSRHRGGSAAIAA